MEPHDLSDDDLSALARRLHDDLGRAVLLMKFDVERFVARAGRLGLDEDDKRLLAALRSRAEDALTTIHEICPDAQTIQPARTIDLARAVRTVSHDAARAWGARVQVVTGGAPVLIGSVRAGLALAVCRDALAIARDDLAATEVVARVHRRGHSFNLCIAARGGPGGAGALAAADRLGLARMRQTARTLGGMLDVVRHLDRTTFVLAAPLNPGNF